MPARITLLTDFGTRDGYVAAMRGVIAAITPDATVDDATHDILPGDILAGALALERYWRLYPPGTVHVAVVDPGVGTARRAIAASADGRRFVAPDNGILSFVLRAVDRADVHEIREPAFLHHPVSATFHGRDVFASAAAHLAGRVGPDAVGPLVSDPVMLDPVEPVPDRGGVSGVILVEDRFGNLITNIPGDAVADGAAVSVEGHAPVRVRRTYGEVDPGEVIALVGSSDRLEISVRDGSAADRLGVGRGARVRVEG